MDKNTNAYEYIICIISHLLLFGYFLQKRLGTRKYKMVSYMGDMHDQIGVNLSTGMQEACVSVEKNTLENVFHSVSKFGSRHMTCPRAESSFIGRRTPTSAHNKRGKKDPYILQYGWRNLLVPECVLSGGPTQSYGMGSPLCYVWPNCRLTDRFRGTWGGMGITYQAF